MVECIGTTASVLVALSLMMKNVWRLRWINLVGALFFALYGFLLEAWPVFGVNAFISVIDIWYLVQMSLDKDAFSTLEVTDGNREYLRRFTQFHQADITRFFPDFKADDTPPGTRYLFILRNLLPVGLFVFQRAEGGTDIEILLDYVISDYRDFENGAFLYSAHEMERLNEGATAFTARTDSPAHQAYLRRMGFTEEAAGVFRRAVG